MNKILFVLILTIATSASVEASTITLPDSGTYYYWIRSASGSVQLPPRKVSGTGEINAGKTGPQSGTLFVLDPHTGGIASVPLSQSSSISVTIDQFHVPAGPENSAVTQSPPAQTSATVQPQLTAPSGQSTVSRVVTFVLSLALLGIVIWFVRSLYLSRGQILIEAARKVGVDVPNPGDPIPVGVSIEGKYEAPPQPKVQRIPEEAFKVAPPTSSHGYLVAADGTAYGLGKRPLRIGRDADNDIILADPSVSRHHAIVEIVAGSVQITDQGSANGVYVGGERIGSAVLLPGTRFLVGQVPLSFQE